MLRAQTSLLHHLNVEILLKVKITHAQMTTMHAFSGIYPSIMYDPIPYNISVNNTVNDLLVIYEEIPFILVLACELSFITIFIRKKIHRRTQAQHTYNA